MLVPVERVAERDEHEDDRGADVAADGGDRAPTAARRGTTKTSQARKPRAPRPPRIASEDRADDERDRARRSPRDRSPANGGRATAPRHGGRCAPELVALRIEAAGTSRPSTRPPACVRRAGPRAGTRGSGSGSRRRSTASSRCPGACQDRPSLNAWISPISIAPSTAPGRLPMPPRTAAVNAISPSWKPWSKRMFVDVERVEQARRRRRATPAIRNVNEIVRLTLMPIIAAASVVLGGRAHRLALPRALHEPDEQEQHGDGDEHDDELVPLVVGAADR